MGKLRLGLAAAFFAAGVGLIGYGLMTPAKAWLAGHLLDHAWERVLAGDENVRPWPWMDSEPVAKLSFQKADAEASGEQPSFVVMRGVSGSVLAFAPGWHERTMLPGTKGTTLISAHRDTHFTILKDINRDDRLMIQDRAGKGGLPGERDDRHRRAGAQPQAYRRSSAPDPGHLLSSGCLASEQP